MTRRVWLEVALNGPWSRERQPLIPVSVAEIVAEGVACAEAGAAIVHVHPYDEASGRQRDDWQIYARIIEGIRARSDAIVYPTIPFAGDVDAAEPMSGPERFAAVAELAKRGLLDLAICDPGSTNITSYDDLAAGRRGFLYANPEEHIETGLAIAAAHGLTPNAAVYEPGFLRLGAAMIRQRPSIPATMYRLMFSDHFTFGFPPAPFALDAYHALLQRVAPEAHWMVAGLNVDTQPLYEQAIRLGGHVRTGLEDAPLGSERSNMAWTESAVREIRRAGAEPAGAAEVRAALRVPAASPA